MFFVFTGVYSKKLNILHGVVLLVALIGANVRYTSTVSLEHRSGKKLDHGIELWVDLFNGVPDTTMEKIKKYSFPFKERLVAAYILILITVIHSS